MASLQLVERFMVRLYSIVAVLLLQHCFERKIVIRAQSGRIVPADITVVVMHVALKIVFVLQF